VATQRAALQVTVAFLQLLFGLLHSPARGDQLAHVNHVEEHAVIDAVPVDRLHPKNHVRSGDTAFQNKRRGAGLRLEAFDPGANAPGNVSLRLGGGDSCLGFSMLRS